MQKIFYHAVGAIVLRNQLLEQCPTFLGILHNLWITFTQTEINIEMATKSLNA